VNCHYSTTDGLQNHTYLQKPISVVDLQRSTSSKKRGIRHKKRTIPQFSKKTPGCKLFFLDAMNKYGNTANNSDNGSFGYFVNFQTFAKFPQQFGSTKARTTVVQR
jgi:hypothetical protein